MRSSVYRRKYGKTLKEIGQAMGISSTTVYFMEQRGELNMPLIESTLDNPATYAKGLNRIKAIYSRIVVTHYNVRYRCSNPKDPKYKYYGGKGIKYLLTEIQLLYLWERDEASKMEKPSIDRIDPAGNYELKNCRFIELVENVSRRWEV